MAPFLRKLLIALSLTVILGAVCVGIYLANEPAPLDAPLPNPNGYDDLVNAGRMLSGDFGNYPEMDADELRELLRDSAPALELARTGLTRECRVPPDYLPTMETRSSAFSGIRRLAQSFAASGRLAEMEGRPNDAADFYFDAMRVGAALARGGVLIDSLVGIACETLGLRELESLAANLDAQQCRRLAAAIEELDAARESEEAIRKQERQWARRAYGLRGQVVRLAMYRSLKQTELKWSQKFKAHQARVQTLCIVLAERAYELDHGQPPKTHADLVPAYLKSVPVPIPAATPNED